MSNDLSFISNRNCTMHQGSLNKFSPAIQLKHCWYFSPIISFSVLIFGSKTSPRCANPLCQPVYYSTRRCMVNFWQRLTAFVLQLSVATGYLVLITCCLINNVYELRLNAFKCVCPHCDKTNKKSHIKMVHQRETQLSLFFPSLLLLMTLSMLSFSVIAQ